MPTGSYRSQRSIYDERYQTGLYDQRSVVRVLTAEREALSEAMGRALKSHPKVRQISLFDFGYGTGRVTNEMVANYADQYIALGKDLLVVAYDVSSAGLKKAQESLTSAGFTSARDLAWDPGALEGYIAGSIHKEEAGIRITVVFIHGREEDPPDVMHRLALRANDGDRYLVTTSWYSGLGHVVGHELRREYFRQIGGIASATGEVVLAVSSAGDLADLQSRWATILANGAAGDFRVTAPGDVVYETELGQANFYHIFSTDLNEHMSAMTAPDQHWWIEGIRYPEEEFGSPESEQLNYRRVCEANARKRGRRWTADDYREYHTVAAFRSPMDPTKL